MTIQDDTVRCDCSGCAMYCRVPSDVFGTGDPDDMRQWAHNNARGGDIGSMNSGSGTLTLNWNTSANQLRDTLDYCCNQCAMGTCGHGSGGRRQNATETWKDRFKDRVKKPAPPKPESRFITPIGRMK